MRGKAAGEQATPRLPKAMASSQGHCTRTLCLLTRNITAIITLKFVSGNAIDTRGKHTTGCGNFRSAESLMAVAVATRCVYATFAYFMARSRAKITLITYLKCYYDFFLDKCNLQFELWI